MGTCAAPLRAGRPVDCTYGAQRGSVHLPGRRRSRQSLIRSEFIYVRFQRIVGWQDRGLRARKVSVVFAGSVFAGLGLGCGSSGLTGTMAAAPLFHGGQFSRSCKLGQVRNRKQRQPCNRCCVYSDITFHADHCASRFLPRGECWRRRCNALPDELHVGVTAGGVHEVECIRCKGR